MAAGHLRTLWIFAHHLKSNPKALTLSLIIVLVSPSSHKCVATDLIVGLWLDRLLYGHSSEDYRLSGAYRAPIGRLSGAYRAPIGRLSNAYRAPMGRLSGALPLPILRHILFDQSKLFYRSILDWFYSYYSVNPFWCREQRSSLITIVAPASILQSMTLQSGRLMGGGRLRA